MAQLLLVTAVVTAFFLWLSPEARAVMRRRLPRLLSYLGLGLLALLVATGRLHWMLGLILGAALLGRRLPAKLHGLARAGRNHRTEYSHLQTSNLAITINLRSGCIDGTVLGGHLQGRRLSRLALAELLDLRNSYLAIDGEAAALLTAYLEQAHAGWRARRAGQRDEKASLGLDGDRPLSEAQAYAVLGLATGADQEQIVAAHRRLMQRLHPDRGGSAYLAVRINEAKARLLRGRR